MSAIDLGSALEELIRRIVREELSKLGGKPDEHEAAADAIAEFVAKDAAKLRAARARPAGVDGQPLPRRRRRSTAPPPALARKLTVSQNPRRGCAIAKSLRCAT